MVGSNIATGTIKEVTAFETASFRLEDVVEWLGREDAFFFRMDLKTEPVWTDATKEFEDLALSRLGDNVDELLKQKEAEGLASILGPIVEKYNDQTPLLYGYAAALQDVGQLERAMEYYDRVLKLDAGMFLAWHNRGVLNGDMGNVHDACADFRNAEKLNPDYPGIASKRTAFCKGGQIREKSFERD